MEKQQQKGRDKEVRATGDMCRAENSGAAGRTGLGRDCSGGRTRLAVGGSFPAKGMPCQGPEAARTDVRTRKRLGRGAVETKGINKV